MKQVVQSVRSGALRVVDVPRPVIGPTEVLVATTRSVLSVGTERAVRELASTNLIGKARARPDLVRQVVRRVRNEGLTSTFKAVQARLDEEMPLGYAAAGLVVEVGEAVTGVRPGQRVATGGVGHAELQAVPGLLACPIPDGVADCEAAFATVAAIALHGLRLADVGPGSRVCVVGLGLLGQLATRLALACGYQVAGIDVRGWTVERAIKSGAAAMLDQGSDTTAAVLEWTRGRGVDAVLVTAATASSGPIRRVPALCRDRARIVVVGDVGLDLERAPFYDKELSLCVARSYGPGRYDPMYEKWAVDYPIGQVRWTEGRNLEAFLDLIAAGKLAVGDLITHEFPVERASEAYGVINSGSEPYLGIQLVYSGGVESARREVVLVPRRGADGEGIGLLGAGNFAKMTLVPALKEAGFSNLTFVASRGGHSARHLAETHGFERATSSVSDVLDSEDVDIVVVATPHDTHAELTVRALDAGKHVFTEKPLALSFDELDLVRQAWARNPGLLMVGFNRRWSDFVRRAEEVFGRSGGPLTLVYRVNVDVLRPNHWYNDRRQGGRLLGEVCHFIDTCNAVVGEAPFEVTARGGIGELPGVGSNVVVTLSYADGSLATIAYGCSGHASTHKEHLEINGRGHTVVIDDFRMLRIDGRQVKDAVAGKGHREELLAFRQALRDRRSMEKETLASIASMATTLDAFVSLMYAADSKSDP